MKSIHIILIVFLFMLKISIASNNSFGLRAGLSISNYKDDKVVYQGSPILGLYYNYQINDYLSVQAEINYKSNIQHYYRLENKGTNLEIKYFENLTLNYLEIPLLLKYKYYDHAQIYAGPSINFLIGGEFDQRWENVFNNGLDDHFYSGFNFKNDSNKPGFTIIFGTSYIWNSIIFDIRYFNDLSDSVKKNKTYPNDEIKKFNGFQFSIGAILN